MKIFAKLIAIALVGGLLLSSCESRAEPTDRTDRTPTEVPRVDSTQEASIPDNALVDNSFEAVTAHIDFSLPEELVITRPLEDIALDAENYYITGHADPSGELLLNGEPVESRGGAGSFGVYVPLEEGENTFAFSQGDEVVSVTITRAAEEGYATTDIAARMRPEIDVAARSGAEYRLSCIAPSGASVCAWVGEAFFALEQNAATAVEGVPATFSATVTLPDADGTLELGPVVYVLDYNGETAEFPSEGVLYLVGTEDELVVRGKDMCSTVFAAESLDSDFYSVILQGGTDVVTEIGTSMYKLGMGGWVLKDAVLPQTEAVSYHNRVDSVGYSTVDGYEAVTLHGTTMPLYTAFWEENRHAVTLFHTNGIESVNTAGSEWIHEIAVAEADGHTTLTFLPKPGVRLDGYLVEYDGDTTRIVIKPANALRGDAEMPLAGQTIVLDPGHGGSDGGAAGILGEHGPEEKAVNLAAAQAVGQYLRGMGATVILTRTDDSRIELGERLAVIRGADVDFAISLHCNSISGALDGTGPSGTETYYHETAHQPLAQALNDAICAKTGRKNRGAKRDYFKVTLNSGAPSVLVEMGFLTHPAEYDKLYSKQGIYDLAVAIGEGLIDYLEAPEVTAEE